jgi:predicted MFS family arabinose efflux permease
MLPSLVPREDLSNAVALNSTIFNASRVVGPPLAGMVYAAAGPGWCFAINAISFGAILWALAYIQLAPAPSGIVRTHLWDDLREGLGYVRRHTVVRTLLVLVGLLGTLAFVYIVLMPVLSSRVLGGGPRENGYLLGSAGIGATVGALTVATLQPRRPGRIIVGFSYAASAALVALAFSRHLLLSMVLTAAVAGSVMAVLATCNASIQEHLSDSLRGRIMSIYTLALIGSGPLNAVIAGTLGDALGADWAIGISGVAMAVAVGFVTTRNRLVADLDLSTLVPIGEDAAEAAADS